MSERKRKSTIFRSFLFAELLIIIVLIVSSYNNFVGYVINGDGKGYYEYLPSAFIHKDLNRKDYSEEQMKTFSERTGRFGFYVDYKGYKVDKYPCGTAILQSPFFVVANLITPKEGNYNDGYQNSFSIAIFISTLFYLLLSLVFLRKLLLLYGLGRFEIVLSQVLLVFATSVVQYATANAAFSHVYSLFAITAFFFFTKKYFVDNKKTDFLWMAIFLAFVFAIRNINLVVILFVPFLAGSGLNLQKGFRNIFKNWKTLMTGILLMSCIVFIQMLLWYLQTGSFIVYSYQGEGFDFLHPHFLDILFSYRKGLFVYTPVLLLGLIGAFMFLFRKKYYLFFTWIVFFVVLSWLLSSWWCWYYGRSYGLRAFIDFYAVFFIPLGIAFHFYKRFGKTIVLIVSILTIGLNIIQNYQYRSYIIHGTGMDKGRYWKVFLKTHSCYKGLFYKKNYNEESSQEIFEKKIGAITVPAKNEKIIWKKATSEIPNFNEVKYIQISFKNDFEEKNHARLLLVIKDENKVNLYHRPYFIHFAEGNWGVFQEGEYIYELPHIENPYKKEVSVSVITDDNEVSLDNLTVRFLKK